MAHKKKRKTGKDLLGYNFGDGRIHPSPEGEADEEGSPEDDDASASGFAMSEKSSVVQLMHSVQLGLNPDSL